MYTGGEGVHKSRGNEIANDRMLVSQTSEFSCLVWIPCLDDSIQGSDDRFHLLCSVIVDKGDSNNSIILVHPKMSDQAVSIKMAITNSDLKCPART